MTLLTWKQEFYKKDANAPTTTSEAIEHSLAKWKGLTEKNLLKHGLTKYMWIILDPNLDLEGKPIRELEQLGLTIDNRTCALCQLFEDRCEDCPITFVTGSDCNDEDSPYDNWCEDRNALPMIAALEETLEYYKEIE